MTDKISKSTKRNWSMLGINNVDGKLVSRANKKLSEKTIIPIEYFDNKNNVDLLKKIVDDLSNINGSISDIIFSLGIFLLKKKNIINNDGYSKNACLNEFINNCNNNFIDDILHLYLPNDETDILGLVYQCLLKEGVKNVQGSYYTPKSVVRDMVGDIKLSNNQKVLDPCCGSLVFCLIYRE